MKTPAEKPSARLHRLAQQRLAKQVRRNLFPEPNPEQSTRVLGGAAQSPPALPSAAKDLLTAWYFQVGKRFASAKHEDSEFGRRFIEHGAICIWNCAQELEQRLQGQAGQAPRDLGLKVIQQDPKGP